MQYRNGVSALIWLSLAFSALLFPAATYAAPPATTASFDCAQAKSRIEHAICADPDLAKSDIEIAKTYRTDLAQVSEEGKDILRDGQRQWLKMVSAVCTPKPTTEIGGCFKRFYRDREGRLLDAVRNIGGRVFLRVDMYDVQNAPSDDTGNNAGFATLNFSYPIIDAPKSEAEIRFNAYMKEEAVKQKAQYDGDNSTDQNLEFDEIKVTRHLISVAVDSGFYAHGTPHGQYIGYIVHWLLPEGRLLRAADIFKSNTRWKDVLAERCLESVNHYGFVHSPDELIGLIETPESWSFKPDGLLITFNSYAVASYAEGEPTVLIPWSAMQNYLTPDAKIKILER